MAGLDFKDGIVFIGYKEIPQSFALRFGPS
jgi:hypothetical protein